MTKRLRAILLSAIMVLSTVIPSYADEPEWEWLDPLPNQTEPIMGDSRFEIIGPFADSSEFSASWYANVSIRDDYGTDLLPDRDLGVRVQIDQYLGDADGELNIAELSQFVELVENARNLTDSELLGCCLVDYAEMIPSGRGMEIIVTPPNVGSVDENGSWGWQEEVTLTGNTDSRLIRIIDIPRVGGVIEEIPLNVILPSPWEFRYSAMQSIIEGSPNDFTVYREEAPVTSDIRITLGENAPPSSIASRLTGNSMIPLDALTEYSGECVDSALDDTTQWWTLHNNGTMILQSDGSDFKFIASEMNFSHGEVASVVMHCMDHASASSNWYENIVIDGESPTWDASFTNVVNGDLLLLDSSAEVLEVPSGSELYFDFSASDSNSLPVAIQVFTNKTENWQHSGVDNLEFMDRFFQSQEVNGMHLNVSERHMAKQPSEYELILEITDDAWNSVTKSWTIRVTDMTGPGIIPEILSNETPISPSSPARAGDSIVLSLTQSYDDLDAIEDTTWEISIDGEVIVAQADWSQAEQTTLPISEAGTYVIQVVAWDSAGNKEELSWGLVVSPTSGVYISVLDVTVIGDLVEEEIVNVVVTFENTGADTGTAQLCSGDSCSDDHIVRAAESSGPGVFDIEMYLELSSSDFDLRLDWTSESSSSNGSMEIEHDFVIQPSWQMPLQVVMAVLVLLMLLAWLAHRAWGPESLRP